MSVNYDDGLYRTYGRARGLLPEAMKLWMGVVRRYAGAQKDMVILDLGCGTGRFSAALAESLDATVIGVEPSDKMRAVAESESPHPRVRYAKGDGARIPTDDGTCDLAWLSMVVHHVPDLGACVAELRRVLRPGGLVLVRSAFKDRLGSIRHYEFFPSAAALDEARLPSVEAVRRAFEAGGFRHVASESVEQVINRSFREFVERVRLRGIWTLAMIPDAEFERGLRRMEDAARSEDPAKPVTEVIDLLVFARSQERGAGPSGDGSCRGVMEP